MKAKISILFLACTLSVGLHAEETRHVTHVIEVQTKDAGDRSRLANIGFAPEEFRTGKSYIYGTEKDLQRILLAGFQAQAYEMKDSWRAWNKAAFSDEYHSYDEVNAELESLASKRSDLVSMTSLGKSLENRDVKMIRISGKSVAQAEAAKLPVILYVGCHHAREHLSVEVPLLFAKYLIENYDSDANVKRLVDSREIYVSPMVNPDGHIYDFKKSGGKMWRKNRRPNGDGTFGVDLNRNYGYGWGTGGSSTDTDSDVYMGPQPFSEPETVNVKNFVDSQPRMTSLLTLHTFSELVLYPWGHTNDKIGDKEGFKEDLPVFEKMAQTMANWNQYTPEQASSLYIASGDTTDWAYGVHRIFAFTFELSPNSLFSGGFYPEPTMIKSAFDANIKPMLYMLEYADNPHRATQEPVPAYLSEKPSPAKKGIAAASANDLRF